MRKKAYIYGLILLSSCQPLPIYGFTKTGASYQDYLKDRYECLQQTQQAHGSAYFDMYGGEYYSGVMTNCSLASACMAARGYTQVINGGFMPPPGTKVDCH